MTGNKSSGNKSHPCFFTKRSNDADEKGNKK